MFVPRGNKFYYMIALWPAYARYAATVCFISTMFVTWWFFGYRPLAKKIGYYTSGIQTGAIQPQETVSLRELEKSMSRFPPVTYEEIVHAIALLLMQGGNEVHHVECDAAYVRCKFTGNFESFTTLLQKLRRYKYALWCTQCSIKKNEQRLLIFDCTFKTFIPNLETNV